MVTRIAYPFVGDAVGGSHISSLVLIQNLDRERFEPIIILHELGPLADYLNQKNIPFIHLPIPAYAGSTPNPLAILGNAASAAPTIRRFLRKYKIDIIHANDLRINLTWSLSRLSMKARFVWHQRAFPNSRSLFWQTIPLLAHKTIAISDAVKASLQRGEGTHLTKVYNPFATNADGDSHTAPPTKKQQLNIDNSAIVLTFIGRLVPHKRPDLFIEIVTKLSDELSKPVQGLILGADRGNMMKELRELSQRLHIRNQIHFLGFQSDIDPYLNISDYLIAPCEAEPFGRTLVEAMFAGVPVIAADAGGHQEIIDRPGVGFLCEPDSVEAFVDKILELESDPDLCQAIKSQALDMASKRFSVEAHVANISRIYDKLVKPDVITQGQVQQ